jgi:V/A-type H+-transporting ATPase subunit I
MLQPEQMSRLLIAASKDQMATVIAELYRHHQFHIEEYTDSGEEGYEGFKIGTPLPGASEVSGNLLKVRAIGNAVSVSGDEIEPSQLCTCAEIRSRIERELPGIEREVEELTGRRSKLENRTKELEQKVAELTPFTRVPVDLDLLRGYQRFSVLAGYVAQEVAFTIPCEVHYAPGKDKNFIVVVCPADQRTAAERALQEAGFQSVSIPPESGHAQEHIDEYGKEIAATGQEIAGINEKLLGVKQKHADFLAACEELLRSEAERSEAPLRFATSSQTFVAEGWVPADSVAPITAALEQAAGGRILVSELPVDREHDNVPVEYNNPSFAKPSQVLMDVYSRPKYTEIDPTLMLSIIFPIFFGLILGDVGYGLILLAMAFGLRRFLKGEEGSRLLTVLRNASISSIFFGLLFNEFLGFKLSAIVGFVLGTGGVANPVEHYETLLFSRHLIAEHGGHGPAIPELMVMSIWIGILHISLGRIIGMVNHARQDHGDHRIKAVLANFGWLAVMWGLLIVIWSAAPLPIMPDLRSLPQVMPGVTIGMVLGAVLILAGMAFIARDSALEIVELPTIISHVLSYSRIVAVGLSSVAIAMVVNFLSITMFIEPQLKNFTTFSILIILVGLVVFLIGHALNTALGIMGGGLHSIRLHYVEFFTKFYKGGGIKYVPFGMKRRFTED